MKGKLSAGKKETEDQNERRNEVGFERLKREKEVVAFCILGNQKNKKKKAKKKLDNVKKILTFAVPTNRELINGC